MHWWQATRDCIMLGISIILLTAFGWDARIEWWEAMTMLLFLPIYYVVMFKNEAIQRIAKKYIEVRWNCCARLDLSSMICKDTLIK